MADIINFVIHVCTMKAHITHWALLPLQYLKRMIPGIVVCGLIYQQEEILIDISLAVDNVLNAQKQPM